MFCKNCGAEIPEGSAFCTNCGANAAAAPVQAPEPVYAQPANPAVTVSPSKVLTWGILGLAFSDLGILGIIFSAIGLKKSKLFLLEHGALFGQAKVGRILAKVGLIVSIVMTVLWPFMIAASAALVGEFIDAFSNPMFYY